MKKLIAFSLTLVILLFSGCGFLYPILSPNMDKLPEGELLNSYPSPNSENTINIYLCNGGATVDYAIRGEVVKSDGTKRNIYYEYHCDSAQVEWLSDDTVIINDVTLNIDTDVYDYRSQ